MTFKPTLLLHACCAPCSSATLEKLLKTYHITILYYNPNIFPPNEYERRKSELERFTKDFFANTVAAEKNLFNQIKVIEIPYNQSEFYEAVKNLEAEKEGGKRCFECYALRLQKTAEYAAQHDFDFFTTTLSISPHKNAKKINELGKKAALCYNDKAQFLVADFKKENGFKRSLELSAQYNLYRQTYCGCEFSLRKN